jgi:hypothetical protein
MSEYFVEVVSYDTGEVVKRTEPMCGHRATRVEAGIDMNLNHEQFYVAVVELKTKEQG